MTTRIQIDASAHCQLACPSCPTASGATRPAMSAGHLDPSRFAELLDRNPGLLEVELSNYGEMFLNPRLREILRIAEERQVVLHADNGVNLNHASPETLESLVRHRFRSMTVSLDGASPSSYSQYRIKGDFDRVIANIRRINELKKRRVTAFPLLTWQFIVFGHNEHEIEAAKNLAAELGMGFRPKISWDDDVSPVRNPELVRIQTGLEATRDEHRRKTGASYLRGICHQLWHAPVLNWDGRVMGCCRNFWGEFGGNAFEDGLEASLAGPNMLHARRMLMGRAPERPGIPCSTCDLYLAMKRDRDWIAEKEIDALGAPSAVTLGVAVEPGRTEATHVDLFLAPGAPNRLLIANPPAAKRFKLDDSPATAIVLAPGDYTIYALPKRLDPNFRKQYPALPPIAQPISVPPRPIAQECRIRLGE